ncbi:MAG: glycoside hydrolase family 31 protein [Bacteroidota bacterium]|nr:glycoside hydrolase family 31 protein [Bacteroidota bacterium]
MRNLKKLYVIFMAFLPGLVMAQEYNPVANSSAMVIEEKARFTVLTPEVIRMEWNEDGKFEDHASLAFVNRNLPVPVFKKKEKGGWLEIKTDKVDLKYKIGSGPFTEKNLSISFVMDGKKKTWKPGMANSGNLSGTTRTLDGCDGDSSYNWNTRKKEKIKLEEGIISKDGWVAIEDAQRPVFDNSDYPWVMSRQANKTQDLYFFAYGYDYKLALKDFTKIGGHIALPPKFAFGTWWSRYWEYTDADLRELVDQFKIHSVPLDVFVIDMDWHITSLPGFYKDGKLEKDQAGERYGWTGYTWNRSYFPDPKAFLQWTNKENLKTCLNLHPASGIQPHEEVYPQMAKAMGIDPATKKYVPFDITDKNFAKNYMDIVLHPMEDAGIDFWWLDWQQWGTTKIPGVNPTFYLNYVHYSDMERRNKVRPLIFHRWGGLGNHRYEIGFSGDTRVCWNSLNYQPYFTATAANVGFGYWSHDIGGHNIDPDTPELYTRWIQWGAFSPILRTHCTKDPRIERKIWSYPNEYFYAMRNAFVLRYSLIPYIYTQAHNAYESGISIVHPLYYEYPKEDNAYVFKNEYFFGDDMLINPVTKPIGADSLFTYQQTWLPQGQWFEWYTGTMIDGGKVINRPFTLDEVPVYVKSGAIIPMQPQMSRVDEKPLNPMILNIFPGNSGSCKVYEDEGNNNNFKKGAFAYTSVSFMKKGNTLMNVQIDPVEGSFTGMLQARGYELRLPCTYAPVSVKVNGRELSYSAEATTGSWNYSGQDLETRIYVPECKTSEKVSVEIQFPDYDVKLLSGRKAQIAHMIKFGQFLDNHPWDKAKYSSDQVVSVSQTGIRLTYKKDEVYNEMTKFDDTWNNAVNIIERANAQNKVYLQNLELLKAGGK